MNSDTCYPVDEPCKHASERSQMQKAAYCMILFIWHIQNKQIHKDRKRALAAVAQWIKWWTAKQRVIGSIPSQDTCLGNGPGPQ